MEGRKVGGGGRLRPVMVLEGLLKAGNLFLRDVARLDGGMPSSSTTWLTSAGQPLRNQDRGRWRDEIVARRRPCTWLFAIVLDLVSIVGHMVVPHANYGIAGCSRHARRDGLRLQGRSRVRCLLAKLHVRELVDPATDKKPPETSSQCLCLCAGCALFSDDSLPELRMMFPDNRLVSLGVCGVVRMRTGVYLRGLRFGGGWEKQLAKGDTKFRIARQCSWGGGLS